ncbi:hypothetical protein G7032_20010 [Pseudomonas monteilii]|uniref:hypothetical protein n=1 Tax=Pseudomonas monteilii TaxID=76759 RepID=UPI0015E2B809|nr:hypothetical protein [Pseudomonas monteilii]MBA1318137.1 hypothetical protein [Pseudomonas monteilii]
MNIFYCADLKANALTIFKNHDFVYFASVDDDGVYVARLMEPVMDDKPGLRLVSGDFAIRVIERNDEASLGVRFKDLQLVVSHASDNVAVKLVEGATAELYRDGAKVFILYGCDAEISGSLSGTFGAVMKKAPKAWKK